MIVAGDLTVGALVAITMFGARALSPVQITFLALQQLGASREAAQRFDSLLKLKIDHNAEKAPAVFRPFKGAIRMRDIAYRFPNADDFAIRGVTAEIEPGQVIGIVGSNGSGKSTLLKMILGLYRPMSGQILLDSANMAQIHSPELRATIAFAGSKHEFFYGTIEQNMKLGCPTATIAQIEAVCEELDIDLDGPLFPKRLETRYSAQEFGAMSGPMRQKLCLARAFVKDAPVTLLDEPDAVLDASGAAAFARVIERRRGAKTIVMTLNDRRHLAICDKLLVLNAGKLVRFDDAKTILGEIAAQQAK
ncbi:MAG: ATP-binding cassette domain-containing protein [Pseudomonadota bacterium]